MLEIHVIESAIGRWLIKSTVHLVDCLLGRRLITATSNAQVVFGLSTILDALAK